VAASNRLAMASAGEQSTAQPRSMENLSLPFGSVAGVPIRVHFLLPLVAGLAAVGALMTGAGFLAVIFAILLNGPLLLLTVLVHEMGHVLAARRCGFVPDHILLWPLGGLAYISKDSITPKEQIFVSVSGPATHLPMMLLWAGVLWITNKGHVTLSTAGMGYSTHFIPALGVAMLLNNLAMLLFNLLVPCIPLDCSQIFVSILLLCGCEVTTAAKAMVFVSLPVMACLLAFGVYSWIQGSMMASMTILMVFWLGMQTWKLHQARLQGQLGMIPLFATAMKSPPGGSSASGATAAPAGGGGRFKPFDGAGRTLGDGTSQSQTIGKSTANEVCLASVLAVTMNAYLIAQMSLVATTS